MGASKFTLSCASQGLKLPSVPKKDWPEVDRRLLFILQNVAKIHDPFDPKNEERTGRVIYADGIVSAWRTANARIVNLWAAYADAFRTAALAKLPEFALRLPSGRVKTYYNPSIVRESVVVYDPESGNEVTKPREAMQAVVVRGQAPKFLTGGNLLENVVQATCRDIMTFGAVEIEEKHPSWKFCWSCYDEVIFEVPESETAEAEKAMPEIMCHGDRIREWTKGLPLEVDGGTFDRYTK